MKSSTASDKTSRLDKYSSYHPYLILEITYARAPHPIPTTVVSNATIRAVDNVLMSPDPRAARPVPRGIKVPIKPRVGPIRVMMSVILKDLLVTSSSFSTSFRAKASLEALDMCPVSVILSRIPFCVFVIFALCIVDLTDSIESQFEMSRIKLETSFTETFVLDEYSKINPPREMITNITKINRIITTGIKRLCEIKFKAAVKNAPPGIAIAKTITYNRILYIN